jgi:hypothetical protein
MGHVTLQLDGLPRRHVPQSRTSQHGERTLREYEPSPGWRRIFMQQQPIFRGALAGVCRASWRGLGLSRAVLPGRADWVSYPRERRQPLPQPLDRRRFFERASALPLHSDASCRAGAAAHRCQLVVNSDHLNQVLETDRHIRLSGAAKEPRESDGTMLCRVAILPRVLCGLLDGPSSIIERHRTHRSQAQHMMDRQPRLGGTFLRSRRPLQTDARR